MQTLNFGLIGVGRFGKHYIRLLQKMKGVKLVAVAAKTKDSLKEVSHLLKDDVLQLTNSDALLKMKTIDCVVIATPVSTHFAFAKKAIEAGKNILLEKPMVKNLAEAKKLKGIAKKSRKTFMVAHQFVYNDYVKYLKKEIKRGSLGKVKLVVAQHLYPGPMRNDVGCFWDAGTHELSMLQSLFKPGRIKRAEGSSVAFKKGGFDDLTSATIKFGNGLIANIDICWCYPEKTRAFTIVGSRKTAVFDDVAGKKLIIFPTIHTAKLKNQKLKPVVPKINAKEPLKNELEHFVYCVRNKKNPETGIDSAYEITEWLDKVSRAVKLPRYR
jgi:UDP-2-acetamido-3-amino-2,3-dideoxy-glucuronate N-acetyltransferase